MPAATRDMEVAKAAERSAALTRQLLAFARKQVAMRKVIDLNEVISGMTGMLRRLIGEDIALDWRPAPGDCPVPADPAQIDQIMANLCVNARDAITGVGSVVIETAGMTMDAAFCEAHEGARPGDGVRISVSDTGSGMDAEVLAPHGALDGGVLLLEKPFDGPTLARKVKEALGVRLRV